MKFQKSLYVISLLLLVSGLSLVTTAQRRNTSQERWQYLGQSNVDATRDHDTIRVNSKLAFRAIQLRVQGGEIEFQRVVVHFENGADSEVEIRDRIRAGSQTRAIDLPGDDRRIKSVEVWYGKGNWERRRPNLRLYGMVSTGGYDRDRDIRDRDIRDRDIRDRDIRDSNRPVQTVYCESGDMKRHWCSEGIGRRVTLIRQRSTSPCVQGRTWGVDRSGIWVDRGCRADFEVR